MLLRRLDKKIFAIILIIVVATVSIETYAFTYIQVPDLHAVTSQNAVKSTFWFTESYTFSSNGGTWLIRFYLPNETEPSIDSESVICIFKIAQSSNLGVLNVNLVPEKFKVSAVPPMEGLYTGNQFFAPGSGSYFYSTFSNCTCVHLGNDVSPGSFTVDFAFTFRVYETTLVGIFGLNEATVHFDGTITTP